MGSTQGWIQTALSMLTMLFILWRWSISNRKEIIELQGSVSALTKDVTELRSELHEGDQDRPTKAEISTLREIMSSGFDAIHRELAGFAGKGGLVAKVYDLEHMLREQEKDVHSLDKAQDNARHNLRNDLVERFNKVESRLLRLESIGDGTESR